MLDQVLIQATCCFLGLALGQSLWILQKLSLKHEHDSPWQIPMGFEADTSFPFGDAFEAQDSSLAALYAEEKLEARKANRKLARRALEACPDVSTDAVAEAYNLPKASVRTLSKGNRRGRKVQTHYTTQEIKELAL